MYTKDALGWQYRRDGILSKRIRAQKTKSSYWRDELVGYIVRKAADISYYAFRFTLDLRISSNRAEKANDLIVGKRQKHNETSWSFEESGALAAITMSIMSNKIEHWLCFEVLPVRNLNC